MALVRVDRHPGERPPLAGPTGWPLAERGMLSLCAFSSLSQPPRQVEDVQLFTIASIQAATQ